MRHRTRVEVRVLLASQGILDGRRVHAVDHSIGRPTRTASHRQGPRSLASQGILDQPGSPTPPRQPSNRTVRIQHPCRRPILRGRPRYSRPPHSHQAPTPIRSDGRCARHRPPVFLGRPRYSRLPQSPAALLTIRPNGFAGRVFAPSDRTDSQATWRRSLAKVGSDASRSPLRSVNRRPPTAERFPLSRECPVEGFNVVGTTVGEPPTRLAERL